MERLRTDIQLLREYLGVVHPRQFHQVIGGVLLVFREYEATQRSNERVREVGVGGEVFH